MRCGPHSLRWIRQDVAGLGARENAMKIVVLGATGMIGSRIAAELAERAYEVVAASRASSVDATDPESVAATVRGADAVVCAVSARGVSYTLADVARAVVEGLRRAGVRRLFVVGGAASLEVAPGVRLLDTPDFREEWRAEALQGAEALAFFRSVDDLDWLYVSPAAVIQPGESTGRYRLGGDRLLVHEDGRSEISAEDYAIGMADLIEQDIPARRRVTIAY
jgi:putative NADH-flavin reductase